MTIAGVGAAFWGLVAGAAYLLVMRPAKRWTCSCRPSNLQLLRVELALVAVVAHGADRPGGRKNCRFGPQELQVRRARTAGSRSVRGQGLHGRRRRFRRECRRGRGCSARGLRARLRIRRLRRGPARLLTGGLRREIAGGLARLETRLQLVGGWFGRSLVLAT